MTKLRHLLSYFSRFEIGLWIASVFVTVLSFCLFDRNNWISLLASLIGITAILFNAKGNPFGQLLMVIFSLLYGYISYTFSYYGEMITYLGMTMPMAIFALISWLSHPFQGKKSEVEVAHLRRPEILVMILFTALVTALFYVLLRYFHTANLYPSTLSVTTSFVAVYLTYKRSPYFNLAYAANDIVLIILWILATATDIRYISVVACFVAFLFNDVYAFISWMSIEKRQQAKLTP